MKDIVFGVLAAHGVDPASIRPHDHVKDGIVGQVAGAKAVALWKDLRGEFSKTGLWPIILGGESPQQDPADYEMASEFPVVPLESVREILADLFVERCEKLSEGLGVALDASDSNSTLVEKLDASGVYSFSPGRDPVQPWPTTRLPSEASVSFSCLRDSVAGTPFGVVAFALIPLREPYEAPATLAFLGGEDCPGPAMISAVLKDWQKRYDAVPACITGSSIECFVGNPPADQTQALDLAVEQWIFCEEIVSQGTQSVLALAQNLWRSNTWYFWWD